MTRKIENRDYYRGVKNWIEEIYEKAGYEPEYFFGNRFKEELPTRFYKQTSAENSTETTTTTVEFYDSLLCRVLRNGTSQQVKRIHENPKLFLRLLKMALPELENIDASEIFENKITVQEAIEIEQNGSNILDFKLDRVA